MSKPSKELEAYAMELCKRHGRKCITQKCPLRKFYCYDFPSFRQMWIYSPTATKRNISRVMHQLMEQEGWTHEQVPQQEDGD